MSVRKIVQIDENKCNGCGVCVPSCAEGAIQMIDGKAKVLSDNLCDGLGACLGDCPMDAITIIEREAEEFDEEAVKAHLGKAEKVTHHHEHHPGGGCPGSQMRMLNKAVQSAAVVGEGDVEIKIKSQLQQWPVQLMLVPPTAPYFEGANLLVTADCVPFAYPNYHLDLLKGKKVVVGCPKLDDVAFYASKLTQIIKMNDIKSVTVAFMEVPCCTGIVKAVEKAIADSGKNIALQRVRVGIEGEASKF